MSNNGACIQEQMFHHQKQHLIEKLSGTWEIYVQNAPYFSLISKPGIKVENIKIGQENMKSEQLCQKYLNRDEKWNICESILEINGSCLNQSCGNKLNDLE